MNTATINQAPQSAAGADQDIIAKDGRICVKVDALVKEGEAQGKGFFARSYDSAAEFIGRHKPTLSISIYPRIKLLDEKEVELAVKGLFNRFAPIPKPQIEESERIVDSSAGVRLVLSQLILPSGKNQAYIESRMADVSSLVFRTASEVVAAVRADAPAGIFEDEDAPSEAVRALQLEWMTYADMRAYQVGLSEQERENYNEVLRNLTVDLADRLLQSDGTTAEKFDRAFGTMVGLAKAAATHSENDESARARYEWALKFPTETPVAPALPQEAPAAAVAGGVVEDAAPVGEIPAAQFVQRALSQRGIRQTRPRTETVRVSGLIDNLRSKLLHRYMEEHKGQSTKLEAASAAVEAATDEIMQEAKLTENDMNLLLKHDAAMAIVELFRKVQFKK